ncbi:MAG: response regulator [Balneolales bacterium]|nr:response regulator [Balneolales bacterium]
MNKYIMLVDDNKDDVDLTIMALKFNQIANEVKVAFNGQEAVDMLLGHDDSPLPAVILLDINMPKLNGLETLKILRSNERTKTVPIVILTSSQEEQDLVAGYQSGANSYIKKPVDFENFTEAIRQLGMYWLALNELP